MTIKIPPNLESHASSLRDMGKLWYLKLNKILQNLVR